jgi:hypothetical protein
VPWPQSALNQAIWSFKHFLKFTNIKPTNHFKPNDRQEKEVDQQQIKADSAAECLHYLQIEMTHEPYLRTSAPTGLH